MSEQQPVYGGVQNREREQAHQSQQQQQPWGCQVIGENHAWPGNIRQPATALDQLARVARGIGYVITAATLTKLVWWVWFVI